MTATKKTHDDDSTDYFENEDFTVFCPDCAALSTEDLGEGINWEQPDMRCSVCGTLIPDRIIANSEVEPLSPSESLIDKAIEWVSTDVDHGELVELWELLSYVPEAELTAYINHKRTYAVVPRR